MSAPTGPGPDPRTSVDELRVPPDPSSAEPTLDDAGSSAESTGSVPWSPTGAQARTALLARIAAPVDPEITQVPRPEAMVELRARVLAEAPEVLPAARGPLAHDRARGLYEAPWWSLSGEESTHAGERTGSLGSVLESTGELLTDRSITHASSPASHVRGRRRLVLLAAAVVGLVLLAGLTRGCGVRRMSTTDARPVPSAPALRESHGD